VNDLVSGKRGLLSVRQLPGRSARQQRRCVEYTTAAAPPSAVMRSSRELVGPDITAAVTFERYPRFIKGSFQDYEGPLPMPRMFPSHD
jgi:hypothetical protein